MIRCSFKAEEDDFYCWKYQIWYPSVDCAYRVKFKTFKGCLNCNQGHLNLKAHRWDLRKAKWPLKN